MKRHASLALLPLSLLASCQSFHPGSFGDRSAQEDLRPVFSDARIAELEQLTPQLQHPFRVGIAPPLRETRRHGSAHGSSFGFGAWSSSERELIESWGRELQCEGILQELVFLPSALVDPAALESDNLLRPIREAAARRQVDAVLVVHSVADVGYFDNTLVLFDLTLIGAAFVPGHTVETRAVAEALLVDTRNEYLYLTADGDAEAERRCALVNVDRNGNRMLERVQLEALREVSKDLSAQARAWSALGTGTSGGLEGSRAAGR